MVQSVSEIVTAYLDNVLREVGHALGYRRGVLMFPDFTDRKVMSRAVIGVPEHWKQVEVHGPEDLERPGYWPLHKGHVVHVGRQVGVPFHTCLDDAFMEREAADADSWQHKQRYYALLAEQYEGSRRDDYDSLVRRGILPRDYDFENDFCQTDCMNYDLFVEQNWDFTQMYPSRKIWNRLAKNELARHYAFLQDRGVIGEEEDFETWHSNRSAHEQRLWNLLKEENPHFQDLFPDHETYIESDSYLITRHGFSREQFCHTLMLGIHIDGALVALAQFDFPEGGKGFSEPLSTDAIAVAQQKIARYVPAIVYESVVQHLEAGDNDLAESTLELLVHDKGDRSRLLEEFQIASNNTIFLPSSDVAEGSETVQPVPHLYCVKLYEKDGVAPQDAALRDIITAAREDGRIGIRTFPARGTTSRHLLSEVEPHVTLYDFLPHLSGLDNELALKHGLLGICLADRDAVDALTFPYEPEETDYHAKMVEALAFIGWQGEAAEAATRRIVAPLRNDVRRQDIAPRNTAIDICTIAREFDVSPVKIEEIGKMYQADWQETMAAFLGSFRRTIDRHPGYFLALVARSGMRWRSDFKNLLRLTDPLDDVVEAVDAPMFALSWEERARYFIDSSDRAVHARTYRNARWLMYLDKWHRRRKFPELKEEQRYHLATLERCAQELGESGLLSHIRAARL